MWNESVPRIIINNTINLFFLTAINILVISKHNSFRVLFDKITSVYFIWKIYLYFSIGNGQPREPALCQLYRHTFVTYWLQTLQRTTSLSCKHVYSNGTVHTGVNSQTPVGELQFSSVHVPWTRLRVTTAFAAENAVDVVAKATQRSRGHARLLCWSDWAFTLMKNRRSDENDAKLNLKNCLRSTIEDKPTALSYLLILILAHPWPWPWISSQCFSELWSWPIQSRSKVRRFKS